ncbi:hypothetical protein EQZ23_02710 [Sphingomonas sp. UV9]|uniref:hypothetical protein n=1 Tax=Sphingomonas sp. UV9 TaxID=1851410 RepID=UPI000FFB4683|nr:hypothetical protein [Sphingomonas sp. UV9]RXD07017.1 hypothetical protein EQZ23_02710 [Sphingomonas sp. UV9]
MGWGGPGFVLAIIAITTIGWIANNWIRTKHGYPPSDDWGNTMNWTGAQKQDPASERKVELLSSENERLTGKVSRLEERIAVLERIATDPAERTAREIDALRDR